MITAITPIGLTYAWAAFFDDRYIAAIVVISVCVFLIICTLCFIILVQKKLSRERFVPQTIEAADSENIAFMLLYLLPLFENGFASLNWVMTVPAILIFAGVIWTGYGYHFNPLLGLFGWHFYKVSTAEGVTYILISRKEIRAAKQVMQVGQLTEFMVIDLGD
tara:strand:- start:282 stop:770 length:489 start_codon:yes stop_codon:yes gene_type:complete